MVTAYTSALIGTRQVLVEFHKILIVSLVNILSISLREVVQTSTNSALFLFVLKNSLFSRSLSITSVCTVFP